MTKNAGAGNPDLGCAPLVGVAAAAFALTAGLWWRVAQWWLRVPQPRQQATR